ncbi:MAG: hypothetical protein WC614_13170 [bacterium]
MKDQKTFRIIRKIRRKVAHLIEPSGFERDPFWDIPIDIGIKGANELRKELCIDEQSYLFVAGQSHADARAYVLYTALDEVQKTSIYLMSLRELLQDPFLVTPGDQPGRIVQTHTFEEQETRIRRLLEVLVMLILFDKTNEQPYYRHLLLIEQLEEFLSMNLDLKDFYGAQSMNIEDSIDNQINWIQKVESEIDLQKAWYLRERTRLKPRNELRPGQILSNMRGRIKDATIIMHDREKLLFGFSYFGRYGHASEMIHYRSNKTHSYLTPNPEKDAVYELSLLLISILDRCHRLLGRPELPIMKRILPILDQTKPTSLVYNTTVRDIQVGDFVLAYSDLAEVIEVKESKYGYRSYRIRYLAEKPKPEIQEDWFPAFYVQKFYTRSIFFEKLQKMVEEGQLPSNTMEHIEKLSKDELQTILRQSLVHTWSVGLKTWVHQNKKKPK